MLNYCRTNNLLESLFGHNAMLFCMKTKRLNWVCMTKISMIKNIKVGRPIGHDQWILLQQNQDLFRFLLPELFASANCSGGSGHWGTMSPEIFFENPGDIPSIFPSSINFQLARFHDQMPMEYAITEKLTTMTPGILLKLSKPLTGIRQLQLGTKLL